MFPLGLAPSGRYLHAADGIFHRQSVGATMVVM